MNILADIIKKLTDVPYDAAGSRLAVNGINRYLACSSIANNSRIVVDYESMALVLSINDESTSGKNLILPLFSSSNIISFGDTTTGRVTSYDVRDGKHVNDIIAPG